MSRIFTFVQRALNSNDDLTYSSLHTEATFYKSFVIDLQQCKQTVLIESPYLTTKRVATLLPVLSKLVKRGVVVTISTRHPCEHDAALRDQVYTAMTDLHSIGVDLHLMTGRLHRKLAILDESILWEGSLNILSQNFSTEVMRRTMSKSLSRQMRRFIGY